MKRALGFVFLVLLFLAGVTRSQSTGSQGSQDKGPPDMTGKWKTADGRLFIVKQIGKHLHATFLPGSDKCANGETLNYAFDGDLTGTSGTSLSGKMTACTEPKLTKDCPKLEKVWETTFDATAALDKISGKIVIMGLSVGTENGHYVNCRVDRRYDSKQEFALTWVPCDPLRDAEYSRKKKVAEEILERSFEIMDKQYDEDIELGKEIISELSLGLIEHGAVDVTAEQLPERIETSWDTKIEALSEKLSTPTSDVDAALKVQRDLYSLERDAQRLAPLEKEIVVDAAALIAISDLMVQTASAAAKTSIMVQQHRTVQSEAMKEYDQATKAWQAALAELDKALKRSEECERQRNKLSADKNLVDKAQEILDSWEHNENYTRYKDPAGTIYDAEGALNRAKQILARQSSRLSEDQSRFSIQMVAFVQAESTQGIKVTVQQFRDAIVEIKKADSLFRQAINDLGELFKADRELREQLHFLSSSEPKVAHMMDSESGGQSRGNAFPHTVYPAKQGFKLPTDNLEYRVNFSN